MGIRGRKSAASLTIISSSGVETIQRPGPPGNLTDEQAQEWRDIVNRMPADWFPRETWGLLESYCRHVVEIRHIDQLVVNLKSDDRFDLDEYDQLLKMRERESRAASSLATRMRISQHSSYDKKKTRGSQVRKPWDTDEG